MSRHRRAACWPVHHRDLANVLRTPLGPSSITWNKATAVAELSDGYSNLENCSFVRPPKLKSCGTHSPARSLRSLLRCLRGLSYILLIEEQMTVASDWDDTTWQTHLDGYLSIMSQPEQQPARKAQDTILAKALSYAGEDGSVHSFQSLGLADDMDEAAMLLEVSKLRLRILARKLCMLLRGATPPRKLDVQKLQSSVKQIYADLQLGTLAESPRKTVVARTTNIEYAAVRIVAAGLLIRCGQFLHPTGLFNTTRHFTKLSSSICVAADQICATVASMHPTAICPNTINPIRNRSRPPLAETVMDALSVIWPLFVVSTTANTDDKHRAWAQKLLLTLGNNARIPKALHLVSSSVAFETDLVLDLEANN
jgi:hypothetical protein